MVSRKNKAIRNYEDLKCLTDVVVPEILSWFSKINPYASFIHACKHYLGLENLQNESLDVKMSWLESTHFWTLCAIVLLAVILKMSIMLCVYINNVIRICFRCVLKCNIIILFIDRRISSNRQPDTENVNKIQKCSSFGSSKLPYLLIFYSVSL